MLGVNISKGIQTMIRIVCTFVYPPLAISKLANQIPEALGGGSRELKSISSPSCHAPKGRDRKVVC